MSRHDGIKRPRAPRRRQTEVDDARRATNQLRRDMDAVRRVLDETRSQRRTAVRERDELRAAIDGALAHLRDAAHGDGDIAAVRAAISRLTNARTRP